MDLQGTRRSATSLKRNGEERKGILIAPLMLPSFISSTAFPSLRVFIAASNGKVGFGQNFCGTDGKPMPLVRKGVCQDLSTRSHAMTRT